MSEQEPSLWAKLIFFIAGQLVAIWLVVTTWRKNKTDGYRKESNENDDKLRIEMSTNMETLRKYIRQVELTGNENSRKLAEEIRHELSTKASDEDLKRLLHAVEELRNASVQAQETIIDVLRDK